MNLINFINRFPDEASCIEFFKEQRILQGIIYIRSALVANIIGLEKSALSTVQSVGSEPVSRVVLLWKTATYRLEFG